MHKIATVVLCLSVSLSLGMAQEKSPRPVPANANEKQTTQNPSKASATAKPQALSEEESSQLSQRAEEPGQEVSGGALSNLHLTYIVIALVAAVVVLVLK